jgi:hypothetical protein
VIDAEAFRAFEQEGWDKRAASYGQPAVQAAGCAYQPKR